MGAAEKLDNQIQFNATIDKSILLKSIAKLQSVVEKRNTIPILANVKLEASENSLTLTVTDMDLVVTEEIEANISIAGALTIPALTLYDIVRKLPEGAQVNLESEPSSSRLFVTAGSSKFTLSYLPVEDFPIMSEGDLTHSFTLKSKEFTRLIEKSRFAMSNEETRYYLNGVYLHLIGNKLKAVATDGHRLASIEIDAPEGSAEMPGIIIPRKAVNEVGKLLEDQEEVKISLSDTKIKFNSGKIQLLSKVVDGTFPDYQRVIPDNNTKSMKVSNDDFKEAIDRVSTISSDKTKAVKVLLSKEVVTITSQGVEGTSGKEDIQAEYDGDNIEVGFNSRYMVEMLSLIESDMVNFSFDEPNSPAIVTDASDTGALYIIMPMRV